MDFTLYSIKEEKEEIEENSELFCFVSWRQFMNMSKFLIEALKFSVWRVIKEIQIHLDNLNIYKVQCYVQKKKKNRILSVDTKLA